MTTDDTRAALDAAIDALIVRRADAIAGANDDLPAERAARKAIDRAITAHVEAEIARRLACAPGVEEAIAAVWCDCDHGARCGKEIADDDHSQGHRGSPGDQDDCDCAVAGHFADLRTAIAADKARAVAEVIKVPVAAPAPLGVVVDAVLWAVGQCHDGSDLWSHMKRDPDTFRWSVERVLSGKIRNSPTPEEARRMVDALREAARALDAYQHAGDDPHPSTLERLAGNVSATRKALLRALGVEA